MGVELGENILIGSVGEPVDVLWWCLLNHNVA